MKEKFQIQETEMSTVFARHLRQIPVPPSANHCFANVGRRRVRTKEYTRWRNGAAQVAAYQIRNHLRRGTAFEVKISLNIVAQSDIDNRIKPFLDMLHYAGIISDDRFCWAVSICRDPKLALNFCNAEITGEWYK